MNRPRAWNVELAYYPERNFSLAVRVEGSRELQDAPKLQGGVSGTIRITNTVYLSLEYLRSDFERGLAEDAEEREIEKGYQLGGLLTIEF